MKRGWYSETQAQQLKRVHVYKNPEGKEVRVSQVSDGPDHGITYDDVEDRGEVTEFLRSAPYSVSPYSSGFPSEK